MAIASFGKFSVGLSFLMAGSFHLVMWPRKILRQRRSVENHFSGLDAGDVHDRHVAADHGRELRQAGCGLSLPGASGLSLAPKSTVLAVIWAMPPPEPIDW